jgi:5'-3' exonuclease, N-terminal resolvase-like domain/T4 RNase H, C terminal
MILVDFNQVMISNLMMQLGNHTNIPVEEGLFRHMVINSLRSYKQKFGDEFGEIIIACDDKNYWRKQVFPYYKANRKKNREASEINWTHVFECFNKIKQEIKDNFPYRVIQVDSAEADDIIATLVEENGTDLNGPTKIIILSGDKDFVQLQTYGNVKQYDPVRKKWISHNDPKKFLFEQILKGDTGDGVPNVLSPDTVFVSNGRQRPLTQKKIDKIYSDGGMLLDPQADRNFMRNKQMIDLSMIPVNIKNEVINKYNEESGKDRSKLFNYFIEHKLKLLMENVGEF